MYGYPPTKTVVTPHLNVPMSEWSSGLCSCLEDGSGCCYGFFCSGCSTMESRAALELRSATRCELCLGCALSVISFYWIGWLVHGFLVLKNHELMGSKFNIKPENNCLKSFFCLWCSVCQIDREISQRCRLGQMSVTPKAGTMMF